jgi:hypothetical protein
MSPEMTVRFEIFVAALQVTFSVVVRRFHSNIFIRSSDIGDIVAKVGIFPYSVFTPGCCLAELWRAM